MYKLKEKIIYTHKDFESTVEWFGNQIKKFQIENLELFSIYQGSLTLCHRLSKEHGIPHSILKFQRMDGDDERPIVLHTTESCSISSEEKTFMLVDDVYDSGVTIVTCAEFLKALFPKAKILPYTIFKKEDTAMPECGVTWQWDFDGTWIQFEPWEGKA